MQAAKVILDNEELEVPKNIFDIADDVVSGNAGNSITEIPHVFWCGDDTLHKRNPDYAGNAKCCVTHLVGLPKHAATHAEMPLTPYQVEFFEAVDDPEKFYNKIIKSNKHKGKFRYPRKLLAKLDEIRLFHLLKGRQMGFTELVLRIIQYYSLTKYKPGFVKILTGINVDKTKKIMLRLKELFLHIPYVVQRYVGQLHIHLHNGVMIQGSTTTEESITSETKVRAVFMDEAAKWTIVDDRPVFSGIMPIVRSNKADMFLIGTGKGPVKSFYNIWKDEKTKFLKIEYDIWYTEGNLYTKEEIQDMIDSSEEDPDQEYLCKFTTGERSIFGMLSGDDYEPEDEWLPDGATAESLSDFKMTGDEWG